MVKIYRFILCMTVAVMVGCTADIPFTWTEPGSSTTTTEFTAELDTIIHEYDGTTATDAADDVVGSDKDLYWESNKFTSKINVTYSGNEATVETSLSDVETYIDGAYVAINMAANGVKNVEIIVKGATEDGALKIYGKNKFKLTLSGANITSRRGPAINDQCSKRVFLHIDDGTVNTLSDSGDYVAEPYYTSGKSFDTEDAKGCFFSEGNVILSGTGSLLIDAYHRHGLATDGYLWMRPGVTLAVTHAAKNAIHAKGNAKDNLGIVVNGGYIYANVSADGGKCLKTDNNIVVNSGYLDLNVSGSTYFDAEEGDTSTGTCIKSDLSTAIHGGAIVMKSVGDKGRGINADESLYVTGGEVCAYTIGRTIAADEALSMTGGKVYTFSRDEYAFYSPTISVTSGYLACVSCNESLTVPQQQVTIDGGYIMAYGNTALLNPDTASKRGYVLRQGISIRRDGALAVVADGDCLIAFLPNFDSTASLPILLSAPHIIKGGQYNFCRGGVINGATSQWQGLVAGGTLAGANETVTVAAE